MLRMLDLTSEVMETFKCLLWEVAWNKEYGWVLGQKEWNSLWDEHI